MKYAHINENGKLLGWYSSDINDTIPTPNVEVTDEVWQEALSANANTYQDGSFIYIEPEDTRTYGEKRQFEYPDIGDQLDDLFKAGAFSTEMTATLQAVKDKYPKPTE